MLKFCAKEDFIGKNVVLMGLGLHGGGRAVAQWLFSKGAFVCVTDIRSEKDLHSSVVEIEQYCAEYRAKFPGKAVISGRPEAADIQPR